MKRNKELDRKNSSVYYTLNGKELRDALGRKPEESLDDYKGNLCVPLVIRRDIDENISDEEWNKLASEIINSDSVGHSIDDAINVYFHRDHEKAKYREIIEPLRQNITEDLCEENGVNDNAPRNHYIEFTEELYECSKFAITERQYNALKKDIDEKGYASTATILEVLDLDEIYYVDSVRLGKKILDVELDEKIYETDGLEIDSRGKVTKG